MEEVCER